MVNRAQQLVAGLVLNGFPLPGGVQRCEVARGAVGAEQCSQRRRLPQNRQHRLVLRQVRVLLLGRLLVQRRNDLGVSMVPPTQGLLQPMPEPGQ